MRNPVKRHMHKSVQASIEPDKKRLKQSDAILRDAREDALNELVEPKTITFESGSTICWDGSEDSLQGCLDCVGCSNLTIEDEGEDL